MKRFACLFPATNTGDNNGGTTSYGAIYPLQYGPVENTFNGAADSILVYGASLQRTEQSSLPNLNNVTGAASLRNEAEYAIDYDNLKIAFYPRLFDATRPVAFRQFTISYDYYVSTPTATTLRSSNPTRISAGSKHNQYKLFKVPDVAPEPCE